MNRTEMLSAYIDEVAAEPFAWGKNDGLLMVAEAVRRITGVDHAACYRGRYGSCAEGRRLLGTTPRKFLSGRFEKIHPVKAADGDIAGVRRGRDWAFGLFIGAHVYAQTDSGIGILPRGDAALAFRVI